MGREYLVFGADEYGAIIIVTTEAVDLLMLEKWCDRLEAVVAAVAFRRIRVEGAGIVPHAQVRAGLCGGGGW